MHMFINGKYTCSSNAQYGYKDEDSMAGMGGHSNGGGKSGGAKSGGAKSGGGKSAARSPKSAPPKGQGILTVANMTDCVGPFKVKKGEYVQLRAEYDLKKHPL
jgi:hypothetical protein